MTLFDSQAHDCLRAMLELRGSPQGNFVSLPPAGEALRGMIDWARETHQFAMKNPEVVPVLCENIYLAIDDYRRRLDKFHGGTDRFMRAAAVMSVPQSFPFVLYSEEAKARQLIDKGKHMEALELRGRLLEGFNSRIRPYYKEFLNTVGIGVSVDGVVTHYTDYERWKEYSQTLPKVNP